MRKRDGTVLDAVVLLKRLQFLGGAPESSAAVELLLHLLAFADPPLQAVAALIDTRLPGVAAATFDTPQGRIVQRVLRDNHERSGVTVRGQYHLPLLPEALQMHTPGFLQASKKQVGT